MTGKLQGFGANVEQFVKIAEGLAAGEAGKKETSR